MSVLDTIRRLSKSTITVKRASTAVMDADGIVAETSGASIETVACVQPVTGNEMEHLPQGLHVENVIKVWSADVELVAGDRVTHRNTEYEVRVVRRWDEFLGGWQAFCARSE